MKIKAIQHVQYETPNGPWRSQWHRQPQWGDIEAAILRLEGLLFPSVSLYLAEDAAEDEIPDVDIIGGNDGYWIDVQHGGQAFTYFDDTAPDTCIAIWVSDQGFEPSAKRVCRNRELLLYAVRHYCNTLDLLPTFPWGKR